jgi:magnesium transporter
MGYPVVSSLPDPERVGLCSGVAIIGRATRAVVGPARERPSQLARRHRNTLNSLHHLIDLSAAIRDHGSDGAYGDDWHRVPEWRLVDIDAFRMGAAHPFERVTDKALVQPFGGLDEATWYDVTGTEQEWVEVCRRDLDLTSFSTDLMSRHRRIAFGLVTHRSASFRVPVLGRQASGDVDHLAGVCLGDRLVTFHTSQSTTIDRFVERLTASPDHGRIDSISDLIAALFTHLSFELIDIGHQLRGQIDDLTGRMEQPGAALHSTDLHDVGTMFHGLDAAVDDYRHVLKILAEAQTGVLDLSDTIPPFAIALGNVGALDDDARVYDGRLERLHDRYAAQLQERVNHRINILTVISAIFLPLSLLAGIWGMNFEGMPGIGHRWGFAIMMAVMAALALALGWYFRRRNWF